MMRTIHLPELMILLLHEAKLTIPYFLFAPTSRVERVRAAMLLDALASLRKMGVEVYSYEPPFSTEVAEALGHSRTLATWWSEYRGWLREQIEASGVHCLVVTSPKDYGLDDA